MSGHLHRLAAPKNYPITKKTAHYVVKVNCGPHAMKSSLPALILIRDLLGVTKNYEETKKMMNLGKVLVDNVIRTDVKFPVGFMDTVSIPAEGKNYRVIFAKGPKVTIIEIPEKEAKEKLCKIMNITIVPKGKIQLNLSGGKNILTDKKDYKTGDSLLVSLPDLKVHKHLKFEKDALVYITDGTHIGETAKVIGVKNMIGSNPDRIILDHNGVQFETLKRYVFVIGKEKSELKIHE